MDDALESKAGAVALMVLGAVISLACAAAIGAVALLVVMTPDKPVPGTVMFAGGPTIPGPSKGREFIAQPMRASQSGKCALVVVWQTGMIYCLRNNSDNGNKPMPNGPAIIVQAQAEASAR